jgi:hypothetical protein
MKRADPEVFLLAEASARKAWYPRHGFDGVYDWTGDLGQGAWAGAFDRPGVAGSRLAASGSSRTTTRATASSPRTARR